MKYKYWRKSHNFVIQVPKTVKEAYDIDRQSGTYFCTNAIAKEITDICIAFENLDGVTPDEMRKGNIETGYEHINVHMIFDSNMDGKFNRKAIFLADGHTTAQPSSITYSSFVSRESVWILFLLASLNDFDVFVYGIGNAYLNAK